jgi:hypothetical protein
MGKWASRLEEKRAEASPGSTDKTDKRGVPSVLAVGEKTRFGDFPVVQISAETPAGPTAYQAAQPVTDTLDAFACTDPAANTVSDPAFAQARCTDQKIPAPPYAGTDRTDESPLLSVLSVSVQAEDTAAVAWTGADVAAFEARRDRLLRWGWREGDAEAMAERLTLRDRDGDDRRLCIECANFRGGRCRQPERAGVAPELGTLATMLQRCPAFRPLGDEPC